MGYELNSEDLIYSIKLPSPRLTASTLPLYLHYFVSRVRVMPLPLNKRQIRLLKKLDSNVCSVMDLIGYYGCNIIIPIQRELAYVNVGAAAFLREFRGFPLVRREP